VGGFELAEEIDPPGFAGAMARIALDLLQAKPAPSGSFPVVMDSDIVGVFAHEAFGHNAEGDSVQSRRSILDGRIGETIASPLVTIVDDPTLREGHGFYRYDSEGSAGRKRVLVEKGVLKGFLHNLESAGRAGEKAGGSGRASNHQNMPIVRMSNIFIAPGETPVEDLFKSVDDGVYLKGSSFGYVMAERGQFTVSARQAWRIRKGEKAEPLRDVQVSGRTLETLDKVDAIGDDFKLEQSGGVCGKKGQGMAVDMGGPTVRVSDMLVGGQG
jgi:TldD protein